MTMKFLSILIIIIFKKYMTTEFLYWISKILIRILVTNLSNQSDIEALADARRALKKKRTDLGSNWVLYVLFFVPHNLHLDRCSVRFGTLGFRVRVSGNMFVLGFNDGNVVG